MARMAPGTTSGEEVHQLKKWGCDFGKIYHISMDI
jgi:hypothetical protein